MHFCSTVYIYLIGALKIDCRPHSILLECMASRNVSVDEVIDNITQLTADELEKVYQKSGFFLMDSRLKAKQLRIKGGKILEDLLACLQY